MFKSAAATYPRFAFFSFGMNDMGNYRGNAGSFIAKYEKLLKAFKKTSPKTRLFINGISTPSNDALGHNKSLKNYKKFNQALRKMCGDMNITYIDNSYILEENPKLYAGDGIHVNTGYYPLWLNNMILKAGL
jgi:lysophospholipase L1-like esterase